jgi:2-keto-3-deoxy-L-rhamnonate aldolase RhmA
MENANLFREKLKRGGIPLGTIISFNDPTVTEALCHDLDFVWIDAEHSAMSLPVIQGHVMATKSSRAAAIVRVPWNDPVLIKPILDMGADGIIAPMVRTVEEAKQAVAACLYPPQGIRGYGPRRPSAYGRLGGPDFVRKMNESIIVILQIEHIDAVNNIDAMVQVPGITSLVIGSNDLSGSMGLLGQPRHPHVLESIDKVIAAGRGAGLPVGIGIGNDATVINEWIAKGIQWVAMGNDVGLLLTGLNQVLTDVQAFIDTRP